MSGVFDRGSKGFLFPILFFNFSTKEPSESLREPCGSHKAQTQSSLPVGRVIWHRDRCRYTNCTVLDGLNKLVTLLPWVLSSFYQSHIQQGFTEPLSVTTPSVSQLRLYSKQRFMYTMYKTYKGPLNYGHVPIIRLFFETQSVHVAIM